MTRLQEMTYESEGTMIITCSCGQLNRLPIQLTKTRCGKCKRIFTPRDLSRGVSEPAPPEEDWLGVDEDKEDDVS